MPLYSDLLALPMEATTLVRQKNQPLANWREYVVVPGSEARYMPDYAGAGIDDLTKRRILYRAGTYDAPTARHERLHAAWLDQKTLPTDAELDAALAPVLRVAGSEGLTVPLKALGTYRLEMPSELFSQAGRARFYLNDAVPPEAQAEAFARYVNLLRARDRSNPSYEVEAVADPVIAAEALRRFPQSPRPPVEVTPMTLGELIRRFRQ